MLSRHRRHQTPTFLEGTPGRYLKRETPPPIPICNGFKPLLKATQSLDHGSPGPSGAKEKQNKPKTRTEISSSQSFNGSKSSHQYFVRKGLTPSFSIGNIVQQNVSAPTGHCDEHRVVSMSLQSLPGRTAFSSLDENFVVSTGEEELCLPLPQGWDMEVTPEGKPYYVDHNTRRTHWEHPLKQEILPPGWVKRFTQEQGVVYYNEVEDRFQYEHPCSMNPRCTEEMAVQSNVYSVPQRAESTIEHLNIISEDIPDWLQLYSRAPFDLDYLLERILFQWNLFTLPQLELHEEQLRKLFKQEMINTAIKYERLGREITKELNRRQARF
ncbi:unnamed protein product [Enterobius vermicularis]|uniref:Protein salvador homolog 1 n=1 Tax=Enterobius vermicularis TaxID=51028 RepID=A0A0N4VFX7_ENTVE|nr:unnamed protein product [Enterobius vermicularis]